MNNNLYHWHDEQIVQHEMREVDRAVEQARLLREAGFASETWLARSIHAVRNLLKALRKGFQDHQSIEPKGYSTKQRNQL